MLSSHYPIDHDHQAPAPSSTATSFFRRTMRGSSDHYGEDSHDSASDQDELVGSTDMDDDDLSDTEEIQFTYCNNNSTTHLHSADDTGQDNELCPGPPTACCCEATKNNNYNNNNVHKHPDAAEAAAYTQTPCERHSTLRLRVHLCSWAAAVAASAFALLIWFPLYLRQLSETSAGWTDRPLNAYGSLLSVGAIVTIGFFGASMALRAVRKWEDVRVMVTPLPWKRLITIAIVCGVSSTIILISSYHRVACHLQDPLKGFILAFAVVFYFIFCKKVMGLQKIFSATTSVVGLFISVDYGLCDAYRCRGVDVPLTVSNLHPPVGWQRRAVWTIVYIGGLALWTLSFSLLEGVVVSSYENHTRKVYPNRLLATVSRMVSIANDERTTKASSSKAPKKKPKALLVAAWIHLVALIVAVPLGLIDVIPGTGPTTPWNEFWPSTMRTVLCHLNLRSQLAEPFENPFLRQQKTLEFLSNLTPGSHRYNETVQMLRRDRRQVHSYEPNPSASSNPHRRLNESLHESVVNGTVHLNLLSHLNHPNRHHSPVAVHSPPAHHPPSSNDTNESSAARKINTDKSSSHKSIHNLKYKHRQAHNFTSIASGVHNQTPIKVSKLVLNHISTPDDDLQSVWPVVRGALVLSCIYVTFTGSALHFLFETESAVFTVAVMSLALPLGGIFWSFFKLTTTTGTDVATIVWAPNVTGELICSLLGTPIVLLGLCLFGLAHLNDAVHRQRMYTSIAS